MATMEKSITIDSPVERVFDYLRDPKSNLEWFPGMEEIKDVTGEGVGAHFRWVYRMAGFPLEGETAVLQFVPNERMVTQSKGGIASTWTWAFAAVNGGARVDLAVEYTVPVPVLGKVAEALVVKQNDRALDVAAANIKARVEDQGVATRAS